MAVGSRGTPRFQSPWVSEVPGWKGRAKSYIADSLGPRFLGALEGRRPEAGAWAREQG